MNNELLALLCDDRNKSTRWPTVHTHRRKKNSSRLAGEKEERNLNVAENVVMEVPTPTSLYIHALLFDNQAACRFVVEH